MTVPSFLPLLQVSHLTRHFISLHEQTIICQMTWHKLNCTALPAPLRDPE